jgi:anti-anti-sigma factor
MVPDLTEACVEISERRVGDVVVLSISGDITLGGGGTMLFADTMRSVLQQGYECVVLDVANVIHVDSWGLGELTQWNAAAHNRGVSLKLLHVGGRFAEFLALTRLDLVFERIGHDSDVLATLTESPRASPNDDAP